MNAPRGAHSGTAALLAATDRVHRHVASEETNDVAQVMATVSAEVCYMLPDVTGTSPELVVLTDRTEVQGYYADERNFMEIVSSTVLVGLTTDWYTFHESVSTTREVATGGHYQNDVAILFPVADDGIVGEILAARRPWHEVYAGVPDPADAVGAPEVAARRREAQGAHQAFLESLAGGADAAGFFEPAARIAVRDPTVASGAYVASGPGGVGGRCDLVGRAIEEPELHVINRVVGDWYVFAEWAVRGRARVGLDGVRAGDPVELRSAGVFPVGGSGRLAGEQTYGFWAPG